MKRPIAACIVTALLLATTACRGEALAASPARLVDPDAATRTELHRAVAEALNDPGITLSDDALTGASLLVIERRRRVNPDGTRVMGRELAVPERFRLLRDGATCMLEHEGSGRRFPLAGAVCAPEPR